MADIIDRDELIRGALEAYQRALEKVGNSFKDIVHVVRCKECKRSYGSVCKTDDKHLFCKMTNHLMWVDDFCSWGERRDDG